MGGYNNNYDQIKALYDAMQAQQYSSYNNMPMASTSTTTSNYMQPRSNIKAGDFVTTPDIDNGKLEHCETSGCDIHDRYYSTKGGTRYVSMTEYELNGVQVIKVNDSGTWAILRVLTKGTSGSFHHVQVAFRTERMSLKYNSKQQRQVEKPNVDLKHLDHLVMNKEAKDELVAVLKQKEHQKKMFEEWGLGEVIQYGKGMTLLFYGPPGTGKTWAATCVAKVFGTELITIGAAEIQTSEPGGANRNIQNAFAEAKKTGKVLFLDECDSLITTRSDVGMILGGEINTLLTEIEKTEGVVILATNRIDTLDEALERRIALIVEFPEPDFEQRQKIWEVMLPKKLPLATEITPKLLAEWKLTGGQIKNVLLQSARLALAEGCSKVEVKHMEAAVDRLHKSKALMGQKSRYNQMHDGMDKVMKKDVDLVKGDA